MDFFIVLIMTNKPYSKKELAQKIKNQKNFILIQAIMVILMIILAVLTTLEKGISFLTFLPLFFIPMLFVMFFELKKLKKQISEKHE